MTSKFANIDTTKSQYIQNPSNLQKPDPSVGAESNRPSAFYSNNVEEKPAGFSNPLYQSKADYNQGTERPSQLTSTNRPSILPSKEINLNKESVPFKLNPGFTIGGDLNQNRGTLLSQQFDAMLPLNKTTEANLQRIADQVNQESQIKTTKKLDNYQFGVRAGPEVDVDVKETSSEFYSNLALKSKNMMDLLQSLSDSTVFSDDTYKKFKIKRTANKDEINQFEGEIISKQDIEDLSTLYTELKVIDALALSVDKYSELAADAVKLSEYFREQGIEVSPKEYLDLDTEFVNIHDAVSKEQQILKSNLEKFLDVWKSKPNTPDCEEKAHILFKGLQDHKKTYQTGWDKAAKLMTLLANIFEDFAKDVYRNTNTYKTKIAKLRSCKHEIELADSYNRKLVAIANNLENGIKTLKRLFAVGKTNSPSLDKAPDYIDQLKIIDENIKQSKLELAKIRYHIKNFGDPCSVETQYFQVFRYKLRDQLEFSLIECERKIDLIKGLGEALFALEKSEQAFINMYLADDGAQRKLENSVRDLSSKIEGKSFANDADKMAEIKKHCKQFNTIIAEYNTHYKKIKSFLDNSDINDALGPLLIAYSTKLNDVIRNCMNQNEKVYKMRFIASEIDNQFKNIESSGSGSVTQFTKFLNTIMNNNLYTFSDDFINQQSLLQKTLSETRKDCTNVESLLVKTNTGETRKKMQAMIATFKTNDENLQLLDEIITATGKIKMTLENLTEKTKTREVVKYIELNAGNIKDEKNFIDQVVGKLTKFINDKSGPDFDNILKVSKWYIGQFQGVSQIYQMTVELFTKKLPKIRVLPDSSKELDATYKDFDKAVTKELENIKDKSISSKFDNILTKWADILKNKVKEESTQIQYRNDSLLFLQDKLDRLELYNFREFEGIRNDLAEIRKKHNHSTPSTIESILNDLISIKHTSISEYILNLGYDYKNETELSNWLNKTLPGLCKSISDKAENHDFDQDFGDSSIKHEFISWGLEISKSMASLQKLLEGLSLRLVEFQTKKLYGRYQNVKDFLNDFVQTYEDITRKFSNNNQHFKNFSKFSPVIDMVAFYNRFYEFDSQNYKPITDFSTAYNKYVDAVKKYGADYKNYININSELMKAKDNYDSAYEKVKLVFSGVITMSQKIEELFEKENNLNSTIDEIFEIVGKDAEDLNLKRLNDLHSKKIVAATNEVYHGDLEDAYAKVLPTIVKYCDDKVNAPKPPTQNNLGQSQNNLQGSQTQNQNQGITTQKTLPQDNKLAQSQTVPLQNSQNQGISTQLPKSNTNNPQTSKPNGGSIADIKPNKPVLDTDEDIN